MNKFIIVIGDSVQRGVYKDIVACLQDQDLMEEECLKKDHSNNLCELSLNAQGEESHMDNDLIEGGGLADDRNAYTEVRQYQSNFHLVRFFFVTRCYSKYMETIFADIKRDEFVPDVVIINSLIWDISRYGQRGLNAYKENLQIAMQRFKRVLGKHTLFIWNTTMPVARRAKVGFLPIQSALQDSLSYDVLVANHLSAQIVRDFGFGVLDLHYWFKEERFMRHRRDDGVHWDAWIHRSITVHILRHIHDAWRIPLPSTVRLINLKRHPRRLTHDTSDTLECSKTIHRTTSLTDLPLTPLMVPNNDHNIDMQHYDIDTDFEVCWREAVSAVPCPGDGVQKHGKMPDHHFRKKVHDMPGPGSHGNSGKLFPSPQKSVCASNMYGAGYPGGLGRKTLLTTPGYDTAGHPQ